LSDRYTRIFLLSHMRAYTSLVGHILGSHPRINGYYEMHLDYRDPGALERQLQEYNHHDELKPASRYLFDKLLHNDYGLGRGVLDSEACLLIALRKPAQTIRSIVQLFRQKPVARRYAEPGEAAAYYIDRLRWLDDFSEHNTGRYQYFDSEALLAQPAALLSTLGGWLGLNEPLEQRYEQFSQTAVERKGDNSKRIRSGKIEREASDYSAIDIPQGLLDEADEVYRSTRRRLADNALDRLLLG
jgi:hypothetical protein